MGIKGNFFSFYFLSIGSKKISYKQCFDTVCEICKISEEAFKIKQDNSVKLDNI